MKKLITIIMILALLLPAAATADIPDISGLSFSELGQLIREAKKALWACDEWKEVKVPAGVYKIGEDIPAGQWSIQAPSGEFVTVGYGSKLDHTGTALDSDSIDYWGNISGSATDNSLHQLDIILEDGYYIVFHKSVLFYPYVKKLDFSFN